MSIGGVPPVGGGYLGGAQGPGEVPQRAKDDVADMVDDMDKVRGLYAQYLQSHDPAEQQNILKQIRDKLSDIEGKCNELDSMKPPLPREILTQVNLVLSKVKECEDDMDSHDPYGGIEHDLYPAIQDLSTLINK